MAGGPTQPAPPSRAPHRLSASCGAPPRKRASGGPAGETGLDTRQPSGLADETRAPPGPPSAISRGNAATQRRLRLELAGAESPAAVAKAVRTQLATIARASTFVDWQHRRALVDDLQLQRRAIVDTVTPRDPVAGLDLMWRFLALAGSVFARSPGGTGGRKRRRRC